ncbi:hypothetical protein D1AOALGA4SA_10481 [Olavius algarvensis Delta 1 endosymbiont]|nr:hypothetical protein D1AOALGA4SA_10481 [Olavius algarvensis Delta 1 endosymbiont]
MGFIVKQLTIIAKQVGSGRFVAGKTYELSISRSKLNLGN